MLETTVKVGKVGEMNYQNEGFEKGLQYQRFICNKLGLIDYKSTKEQYELGETLFGVEIKFDDIMKSTNNLWIEMEEKTNSDNDIWVKSGIQRQDNSWLYLIGDYTRAFCFVKNALIEYQMWHNKELPVIINNTLTSKGFLLPIKIAKEICAKDFELVGESLIV